ncbi:MAG TPA: GAF domain-containing protein, partial [Chthoniobacterales bacterium]|nr:GAF domain-containing protein [Chthoniobacterales bacterium]
MNSAAIPTLAAIAIQGALGLAVFQANPRRRANQCFLLLSGVIAVWLGNLYLIFVVDSPAAAEFHIRQASAAGGWILVVFNLLRLCIRHPEESWRRIFFKARYWLLAGAVMTAYCQTGFFLVGAKTSPLGATGGTFTPVYGPGLSLFVVYFATLSLAIITYYVRDVKRASGSQRAELAFILIGAAVTLATLALAFTLRLYLDESRLIWFAPFRIVLFSLIIAYGMATRKIMEVGVFLRRAMGYGLLTTYLLVVYGAVWWLFAAVTVPNIGQQAYGFAHVVAAVIIAFAMAPARGVSQRLADRLFIGTHRLDFAATVSTATAILRSVTTLDELLEKFARTIAEAVDTDRVVILLPSRDGYAQHYPPPVGAEPRVPIEFSKDDELVAHLQQHSEPIVLEELRRIRLTPQLTRIQAKMEQLNVAVALAILSREHLAGVMLLGPRVSGRIYGSTEQNALQVLCGQLAVAVENAQLFTEVQ